MTYYLSLADGNTRAVTTAKARVLFMRARSLDQGVDSKRASAEAVAWEPDWSREADFWPDARGAGRMVTNEEWERGIVEMVVASMPKP